VATGERSFADSIIDSAGSHSAVNHAPLPAFSYVEQPSKTTRPPFLGENARLGRFPRPKLLPRGHSSSSLALGLRLFRAARRFTFVGSRLLRSAARFICRE